MTQRVRQSLKAVRNSLWFVPGLMTLGAIALASMMVHLDQRLDAASRPNSIWLFGGGPESARGVLSAIAGTTITVAATVFSIMVVALQLASSQFTPRLLGSLMRDRGNQYTLGVFIGTFTYSLLVLRTVRSLSEAGAAFIPSASVSLAIVLAIASIAFLIFFIHHSARSMQASNVIARAAEDALHLTDRIYPEQAESNATHRSQPQFDSPVVIQSDRAGYLETVDISRLISIAGSTGLLLRIDLKIGDYLLPGAVLITASVSSPLAVAQLALLDGAIGANAAIRAAFTISKERNEHDDLAYSVQRLADIAVKALSPGINDPTTAILCIDRLSEIVAYAGSRTPLPCIYDDAEGETRLLWQHDPFDQIVGIAFRGVSRYGADNARVLVYVARMMSMLASLLPEQRLAPLREEARALAENGKAGLTLEQERAALAAWTTWATI